MPVKIVRARKQHECAMHRDATSGLAVAFPPLQCSHNLIIEVSEQCVYQSEYDENEGKWHSLYFHLDCWDRKETAGIIPVVPGSFEAGAHR